MSKLFSSRNNWLRYWRNSLADSESGKGVLKKEDLSKHLQFNKSDFEPRRVNNTNVIKKLFEKEKKETKLVKVVVRLVVYSSRDERGKKHTSIQPDVISPITCFLWISKEGWFYPAGNPTVPRDLLSPQSDDKFTLLDVDELDKFHTLNEIISFSEEEALTWVKHEENPEKCFNTWKLYHKNSQDLFRKLDTKKLTEKYLYAEKPKAYLIKVDDSENFSRKILDLYDWLKDKEVILPLLENYALGEVKNHVPCLESSTNLSSRLGHPNSKFPLAREQRDALTQVMSMQDGEILAINGPPGTGKTTFVLSVIASMWIKAALNEDEPPLIIAASTNNQAVTNIIDAFGKDFEENDGTFSGRWLLDIKSYGGYFPSESKLKEKEVSTLYHTKLFYESLENSKYLERAEMNFLKKAKNAFEDKEFKTIESVKKELYKTIKEYDMRLKQLSFNWNKLEEAKSQCIEEYGCSIQESVEKLTIRDKRLKSVEKDRKKWKNYLAHESIWLTLFRWLPPVKHKLLLLRDIFIEDEFGEEGKAIVKNDPKDDELLKKWISSEQENCNQHSKQNDEWLFVQCTWDKSTENFKVSDKNNINDIDKVLDTTLRFELFQVTVHYWEARWLLECSKLQNIKKQYPNNKPEPIRRGYETVRPRWRRRMMLTPCIVSTLHSLPKHMTYWKYGSDGDDYLINEIDLLIVDEAGQVAPEVAGASFALAKKALVIGDIHQIEPIRSLTYSVDMGNLMQNKLLTDKSQYEKLNKTGATVTEGSVMKIAQRVSRYHYQKKAEPGMFLREHHRCYDEIISFCNDLCYQGLLISKRGNASDMLFPPMAYLHIDGRAEVTETGSRTNPLEAKQIALWLKENRALIEKKYQKEEKNRLEDLVGIVTPFKSQQKCIEEECKKQKINIDVMTIGTVHSLQGAERPIIMFSAVYSRHSDGGFIDMSPSMLNVAVSRAKDSFIVFGDMDVISGASDGKARNILARYLFKSASNELIFPLNKRPDLLDICSTPRLINNASEHDRFLKRLLDESIEQISLVSPWVLLSKLEETGIYEKMVSAVNRGVKVHFYSDKHFNTTTMNEHNEEKDRRFKDCCNQLESDGISVFVVNGVHSKLVMSDNKYLIVGSYNWGSAVRIRKYANMETSMVYAGDLEEEITLQIKALKSRLSSFENIKYKKVKNGYNTYN